MIIGAHLNKDKTIIRTIANIYREGGNALQIFTGSPLNAKIKAINPDELEEIRDYAKLKNVKLIIHASYMINIAKEFKNNKRVIDMEDCYWIQLILNELNISNIINSIGVVIHTGKYLNLDKNEAINNMKLTLSYIISQMIKNDYKTTLILETPSGQGTELLTTLEDFFNFYNLFSIEEKKYLKICIDTCHIFNLGYDIDEFLINIKQEDIKNVILIHLNNSKNEKGSRKDRHEEILNKNGKIQIPNIINFIKRLNNKTIIILEKPSENLNKEINDIKLMKDI